jgi:hypothetical protein
MAIPIKIEKVNLKSTRNIIEHTKYLITVEDKGTKWLLTYQASKEELIKFKDEIQNIITNTSIAETLSVTEDQERVLEDFYKTDSLCKVCKYKLTYHCKDCVFKMQSPLERKLYIALVDSSIKFSPQYPIDWKGNYSLAFENKLPNSPPNFKYVLTIADFYIQRGNRKLCIYADGHTYHERTEEQATRDKNIDRKLQSFDYTVLRYTGKEINDNIDIVVREIKDWYEKGSI